MEIGEIIQDSFIYPLGNVKALALYVVLGIIAVISMVGTVLGVLIGAYADSAATIGVFGIVGFIVSFVILLLISGYQLDVIKYGIRRSYDAPEIDFVRQVLNGIKLIIVNFVYFFIPTIIILIVAFIFRNWITAIIALILYILFHLQHSWLNAD